MPGGRESGGGACRSALDCRGPRTHFKQPPRRHTLPGRRTSAASARSAGERFGCRLLWLAWGRNPDRRLAAFRRFSGGGGCRMGAGGTCCRAVRCASGQPTDRRCAGTRRRAGANASAFPLRYRRPFRNRRAMDVLDRTRRSGFSDPVRPRRYCPYRPRERRRAESGDQRGIHS